MCSVANENDAAGMPFLEWILVYLVNENPALEHELTKSCSCHKPRSAECLLLVRIKNLFAREYVMAVLLENIRDPSRIFRECLKHLVQVSLRDPRLIDVRVFFHLIYSG